MNSDLLPCPTACIKLFLNALPGLGRHECLVVARILDSLISNKPLVVRVAKHALCTCKTHRAFGPTSGRPGRQPSSIGFFNQVSEADPTSRIALEHPLHDRRTVRVDLHGSAFSAVDDLPTIGVADWCAPHGSAGADLLQAALLHFGGQVGAVELSDRTHDAVEQNPGWRLVDALCAADQRCACGLDRHVYGHVVDATSGKPVELVNNDVLDGSIWLGQVLEHRLQARSVGGSGTLAFVAEFLDDDRAEIFSLSQTCFSLGRYGEAFGSASSFGLFFGRDPDVDDG